MHHKTEVILTGAICFCYFWAALVAFVFLVRYPTDADALAYAYLVVLGTGGLHFIFIIYNFVRAYVHEKEYNQFAVDPVWLFLLTDILMAMTLGSTVTANILDYNNYVPVMIGTVTVMGTQLTCLLKVYTLLDEIAEGQRNDDGEFLPP
tara:strand:- start:4865 stop:5311 length:447 start_codon:yes stop_codon:yes gene_type:complete